MPVPDHQDQKHSQPARKAATGARANSKPPMSAQGMLPSSEPAHDWPFQLVAIEPNPAPIPDQLRDREYGYRLPSSKGQHQYRQQNRRPAKSGYRRQGGSEEGKNRQQGKMKEVRHSALKENYHVVAGPATSCGETSDVPCRALLFNNIAL